MPAEGRKERPKKHAEVLEKPKKQQIVQDKLLKTQDVKKLDADASKISLPQVVLWKAFLKH